MKKFFYVLGLFGVFLIFSTPVLAACSWEAETTTYTYSTPGGAPVASISGGCGVKNLQKNSDSKCTGTKPTYSTNSGSTAVCCCAPATATAAETKPTLFTPPDFQVEIPGMKKLSTITCGADKLCEIPWLGKYIAGLYNYALSIAGILAAIMLMAGGLLWLISAGDASRITKAKELILGSVTGLIILACSFVILIQVNPDLAKMKSITIKAIKKLELLAETRNGGTSTNYKSAPCATDDELAAGVDFYATGYYKPAWEDSARFLCVVAMQCSCPKGQDTTKNCDSLYGKTFPNYHPCKSFPKDTPYCNMTSSGSAPQDGDIAGPKNCQSNLPPGTKVCFKGQTYTIRDTGGGITGKRIDVWSGNDLNKAYAVTGIGKLKKGACN